MSYKSHKSPISALLEILDAWRKGQNKSRETTAEEIVCAHERIDGPARTGVFFEPRTTDVFKRMHTNAARIFRWLDDSKDTNLLSVNLLPSILEAMPEELRIHWLNDYLRPLGLCVRNVEQVDGTAPDMNRLLCSVLKETSEAVQSMAESAANPSESNLERAAKELTDIQPAIHAPSGLKAVRAA
jgi:hypothetical protein